MATSMSGAYMQQSPQSATFSNGGDQRHGEGQDGWSGEDSAHDGDSPDKKRKRPMSVSCELCKQRKVKCDRGQPTCGWCAKNGQICEYKERKKPGLRAGYGRELEARLDRLEGILHAQSQTIAQLTQAVQVPNLIPPQTPTPSQPPSAQTAQPDANVFSHPLGITAAEAAPNMQAQDEQRQAPYATPASSSLSGDVRGGMGGGGAGPYGGPFNGYSQAGPPPSEKGEHPMIQSHLQSYYTDSNPPLKSPAMNQGEAHTSIGQDDDLPPYDLLYSLADLYFKHINTWCPILHRRTTLDTLFGTSSLDSDDRALMHAIVATTLRFSNDSRLTPEKKDRYHAVSKRNVFLYGLEHSSVKGLQALVVLALDVCGDSNGPPGWNLLALITRSAVQLGLSVETSSLLVAPKSASIYTLRAVVLPEPANFIEDESRRRLFWMIYILDRYATMPTAFDFALDEREMDRKLPCRDDLFARNQVVETRWFSPRAPDPAIDRPENLGSFSYYIEVVGIISRIHLFLRKPIDIWSASDVESWQAEYRDLNSELSGWKSNLPKEYGNMTRLFDASAGNKIVNCGWVMLHATYFTTVIRLHSSAAFPTNQSNLFKPSLAASQHCLDAVTNISALCGHVNSAGLLNKLGPPFAFSIWVAARVLLIHTATTTHEIDPKLKPFVDTLREMGAYWNVANTYVSLVQRVQEELAESERNAKNAVDGERATPSSVRILADLRRCAYDLDILITRQPRQPAARVRSVTPSRTPAPNELEYLDVFDFFNVPRLSAPFEGPVGTASANTLQVPGAQPYSMPDMSGGQEFNASNFVYSYDPNADWLKG